MKFNPKPGDKIICNNGEEFICCTLEFLHETISKSIRSDKSILGYQKSEYDEGWNDWDEEAFSYSEEYGIREVIPQNVVTPADKKEEVKEEPRYTLQEIKESWDASGWETSTAMWNSFLKNLMKNDEGFQEYLRLRAIYE